MIIALSAASSKAAGDMLPDEGPIEVIKSYFGLLLAKQTAELRVN